MSRLRVHSFSISIDGFVAGPEEDLEEPKPGSGLRFCDSRALAPRSFNNTTVASDRESQIASSLTRSRPIPTASSSACSSIAALLEAIQSAESPHMKGSDLAKLKSLAA
jgi:hypothetical protein